MAETKKKGDIGVAVVMAEAVKRGYKVAVPLGEDWPVDLIIQRNGRLERIQCKYAMSNGAVLEARCRSSNNWSVVKYTPNDIDAIVVYDATTSKTYYVPATMLGPDGRNCISLRLVPTQNGQKKRILYARDFENW
jgi:hypothetical protein